MPSTLSTALSSAFRTTEDHLDALKNMGIRTVGDLLLYLPRAHEDLSSFATLANCPLNEKVSVRGTLGQLKFVRLRGGKSLLTTVFTDTEGATADVTWFNQTHLKRMLSEDMEVVLIGKVIEKSYKLCMNSPQFEPVGKQRLVHSGGIVPIYREHDVITSKWLREKMPLIKDAIKYIPETLSQEIIKEHELMGRAEAIETLHFPQEPEAIERAYARMAFEEMFVLQCDALERKKEWQSVRQDRIRVPMDPELIRRFFSSLQFTPTEGQRIAIYEILRDMEKDVPMSRLLEGDVGSGKTLVAVAVMATALRSKGQTALMVPTEVLARQHAQNVSKLLLGLHEYSVENGLHDFPPPRVALLTGSVPASEAQRIKDGLAGGAVDIVIGTHALIEDSVQFHDLKLVIVDEQHRFGVQQRARLKQKGSPHFLSMTATPIPRTLALTAYGDHDLSVLLEKPGNRQPIHTKVVPPSDRKTVELFIDQQIGEGRQVYTVCPLITGSEAEEIKEVKSVEQEAARLTAAFPHRRISVLHGKMPPKQKEQVLEDFRRREADILVSTSVIEVGIDVPNTTIIVIEGAERFGLSQLHQFRGRVGRGDHKSYCFLFTTTDSQSRSPRLKAMEQHSSGFKLAEIDLALRGPGELYGFRQSGATETYRESIANPELVMKARKAAEKMLGMTADRSA